MPYRTYKNAVLAFRRIFAAALLCVLLIGAAAAQTLIEEVEKGPSGRTICRLYTARL